ncbi:hypothetical protein GNZ12_24130 [Paraburkholderia sp. 1N]|uniref:Uncharacterized protein n=1 Tax=Paraburkholderia solitsugae TaxID=2675748 RepID=A0ABX2BTY0_9BURK|nr:hypothetical protein [Paraburkholderia solitsugae]NPT44342.1 hypothetical protein [Paraburkholderia solitsugae]
MIVKSKGPDKLFGRYNELVLLLLAFVLTTVVGGMLTYAFQTKARANEEHSARLQADLARASQVSEEISRTLDRRLYRTRVLLWAMKDDARDKDLSVARDDYRAALADWNENLNRRYSLAEYSFGRPMRITLEDGLTASFLAIHKEIDDCLRKAGTCDRTKIETLEDVINDLNLNVYRYDTQMLSLIRAGTVGSFLSPPVPLPDRFDMIVFLDHWQTLIGATAGGLMGVVGALIVASRATRRERRIAASALLPELMSFRGAHESLEERARASQFSRTEVEKATCRSLVRVQPPAVILHSPALGQLSDIDARLYAHLNHCELIHRYFERGLAEFERMDNDAKAPMPAANIAESEERLQKKAADVVTNWHLVAEHASLANYYLDRFIFRRWPAWAFKLRMRFLPNDLDQRSKHLLKTGELLRDKDAKPSIDEDKPI